MSDRVEIQYREFFDVPRMFVAADDHSLYLFDGRFDDSIDDYPDSYEVFALPPMRASELPKSWLALRDQAIAALGSIPVASVDFDSTRRQTIGAAILRPFAARLTSAARSSATRTIDRRPPTYA